MTSIAATGVAGVVFGLALAAPPGPMNAVIAEESVLRGWLAGFTAGLGAMTADACFFVLALVGVVAFVREYPTVQGAMVGVGGVLMLYFAYGAVQEALAEAAFTGEDTALDDATPGADTAATPGDGSTPTDGGTEAGAPTTGTDGPLPEGGRRGFTKAFVLALTNPYQIIFWLTVGVKVLEPGRLDVLAEMPYVGDSLAGTLVVQTGSPALLVGFFGGIAVWITAFPATLVTVGRRTDRFAPAVAAASALVLAGFGVLFLVDAGNTLVPLVDDAVDGAL